MNPKHHALGFLDIETSNLKATYGWVFSYSILVADTQKVIQKEFGDKRLYTGLITPEELSGKKNPDHRLIKDCIRDMMKFEVLVTWYGDRFDIPFLRTRAIKCGLDFPLYKSIVHIDAYRIARNRLKLHSNRLQAACQFFGIPSKEHGLNPDVWRWANMGHQKALNYILKHNIEDVHSTEDVYKLIHKYAARTKKSI